MQPVQDRIAIVDLTALRQCGTIDHQHGQAELTGSRDLGSRTLPACILGNDQIDPVFPEQVKVAFDRERTAIDGHRAVGERHGVFRRVDQPQEIVMLWLIPERLEMHPADGEQDAPGLARNGIDCGIDIADMMPAIAFDRLPGWTGQGNQGDSSALRGENRIAAHLPGEWMSRVDDMSDAAGKQVADQAVDAAESTDAGRYGLRFGRCDAAGVAENGGNVVGRQGVGQGAGFGGASENQDFHDG